MLSSGTNTFTNHAPPIAPAPKRQAPKWVDPPMCICLAGSGGTRAPVKGCPAHDPKPQCRCGHNPDTGYRLGIVCPLHDGDIPALPGVDQ